MTARLRKGQPTLPLAFGEAGLPVAPVLRDALAAASRNNSYGPVAGCTELRAAAAGYWQRRGLPTTKAAVVCGPGSKALLFALLLAIGGDVAIPKPSWVSYAAQASLLAARAHFVPAAGGEGGVPDPARLDAVASAASASGRDLRSVVVTLPDNPTGRVAAPDTIRDLCEVAAAHQMIIICDEIYRDLIHESSTPILSPAEVAPDRTVITTGLSKSLALGGWRVGVARMPDGPLGGHLRKALLGAASEIWSVPAVPVQYAAAVAFSEPPDLRARVARSCALHSAVARAAAKVCSAAGLLVPPPQAAFYIYPDFEPFRDYLRSRFGVISSVGLARLLLRRYGAATLPGSAFGDGRRMLAVRLATALIYGDNDTERAAALQAPDPLQHPPIAAALDRLEEILADLTT